MKPNNWILIRNARQLVTLHHLHGPRRGGELSNLAVIPDGSVLLRDGIIEEVGPTRRIENMANARNAQEINAAGRVLMPAFIDPHACLIPVPSYHGDAAPETYGMVAGKRVEALPASRLEAEANDLLKTMARHGAATVAALTGYGVDSTCELKILRALRACDKRPLDVLPVLSVMRQSAEAEELLHCVARRKLANLAQVRCGAGGLSLAEAKAFLQLAKSHGFGLRVALLPAHEPGTVEMAIHLGALSITIVGAIQASDMELLSFASTFTILSPAPPHPNHSRALVRNLIDSGGFIALGSGINPETRGTASMQTVVQLACERLGLSLAEAICATTINAAWALGIGTRVGSVELGKQADIILLNASDFREIPLLAGTNLTHMLMKRGVVVFEQDFPGWPSVQ